MKSIIALLVLFLFSLSAMAETFADKDADQDGQLTKSEFAGDDKKLKKKFLELDENADGVLSEEEFDAYGAADEKNGKKDKKDKKSKKDKKNKKGKKDKNGEENT